MKRWRDEEMKRIIHTIPMMFTIDACHVGTYAI